MTETKSVLETETGAGGSLKRLKKSEDPEEEER